MYRIKKYNGRTKELLTDRELMTSPQTFMGAVEKEYPMVSYEYPDRNTTKMSVWKHLALVSFKPTYVYELIRED